VPPTAGANPPGARLTRRDPASQVRSAHTSASGLASQRGGLGWQSGTGAELRELVSDTDEDSRQARSVSYLIQLGHE